MTDIRETPKSCRGIIVLDSCMLRSMAGAFLPNSLTTPSPLSYLQPRTGTYLDLFPLLARFGYQVIIPEMVMKESADMLANDGGGVTKLYSFFTKSAGTPYFTNEFAIRSFCENAGKGLYPGVSVAKAHIVGSELQQYQHFLSSLHNVCRKKKGDVHRTRNALIRVEKHYNSTDAYGKRLIEDAGEMHAMDIIEGLLPLPSPMGNVPPIFFGTSDEKALETFKKRLAEKKIDSPVQGFKISSLLHMLEDHKLESGKSVASLLGLEKPMEDHWFYAMKQSQEEWFPTYKIQIEHGLAGSALVASIRCSLLKSAVGLAQEVKESIDKRAARKAEHAEPVAMVADTPPVQPPALAVTPVEDTAPVLPAHLVKGCNGDHAIIVKEPAQNPHPAGSQLAKFWERAQKATKPRDAAYRAV